MRKLLILLVLLGGAAGYLYFARGPVGRGVGFARTWAMPEDTGLLAFLPARSPGALVVQLPMVQLPENQRLASELERIRGETLARTGVDLMMDVDAVALSETVQVARGRFRWGELVEKLTLEGFVLDESGATPILKKGDDALAAMRPYLVHGTTANVQAALADKRAGTGLSGDARVLALLKEAGWRSAVLFGVRVEGMARVFPGADMFRNAHASIMPLLGNYRIHAVGTAVSGSEGHRVEADLKEARGKAVIELRRSNSRQAQELAAALEASEIEFSDGNNELRVFLKVPFTVFSDGVEDAARDLGGAALAARFNAKPNPVVPPPAITPPAAGTEPSDADLLELNALVKETCGAGCPLQKRSDLLNVAMRLRLEGKDLASIRAALSSQETPPPVIPAAGSGIGVDVATYGANCGATEGNASQAVKVACNGKKLCRYVVDVGALGDPSPSCAKAFDVSWKCAGGADVYRASVAAEAGLRKSVSLLCD